jgi:hypothetical protein
MLVPFSFLPQVCAYLQGTFKQLVDKEIEKIKEHHRAMT